MFYAPSPSSRESGGALKASPAWFGAEPRPQIQLITYDVIIWRNQSRDSTASREWLSVKMLWILLYIYRQLVVQQIHKKSK